MLKLAIMVTVATKITIAHISCYGYATVNNIWNNGCFPVLD